MTQKDHKEETLEESLLEGLNSGKPQEMNPKEWNKIREEVHRRIDQKINIGITEADAGLGVPVDQKVSQTIIDNVKRRLK